VLPRAARWELNFDPRRLEDVMTTVKSALPPEARKIVAEALQGTLVDLLDLSLVAKQAHWNLVGPRFRSIHLQLDEIVTTARTFSDTVAERCVALGVPADGRAATVAKESGLPQIPSGWVGDDDVVNRFVDIHMTAIERLRRRITETAEPDPVSQDLLISICADLEKAHWMWQAENIKPGPTAPTS
jgi:starvation-inducible DNA-binding protein